MVFHRMTITKLIFFFSLSHDEVKYHLILACHTGSEVLNTGTGQRTKASGFVFLITTDAIYDEEKHKFFLGVLVPGVPK